MAVPTIFTERLVLRQLVDGDAEALHPVFVDAEVMHYWWRAPHETIQETRNAVTRNTEHAGECACWAITLDGAAAIGWVNLREKRAGVAETGYILDRSQWGKGFAKEALTAVISHGFFAMELRRIAADIDPDNAASLALVRSLGFKLEGRLRSEWETHIGVRDSMIFGLLAGEWQGS